MKIAIHVQHLLANSRTGVGYYTYNLVKNILEQDKNNSYGLVTLKLLPTGGKIEFPHELINSHLKIVPMFARVYTLLLKLGLKIPFNLFTGKYDLFVFTNFVAYPVSSGKVATIIYDLSYIRYPEYTERKNLRFLNKFMQETASKVDKIITISEFSKKEIVDYYKVSSEKVAVVYPSTDERFKVLEKRIVDEVKKKYNLNN